MLRFAFFSLLLVGLVGCNTQAPTPMVSAPVSKPAPKAEAPQPPDSELVVFKLPGMTCEGCAKNVERDLAKVDGLKIIVLDPSNNLAKVAVLKNSNVDVQKTLDGLAKTNDNIAGFEIVKTN